jgi:hypothetical protein
MKTPTKHQTYQIVINGKVISEWAAQQARKSFKFLSGSRFVELKDGKEAIQSVAMVRKSDGKIIEAFLKASVAHIPASNLE